MADDNPFAVHNTPRGGPGYDRPEQVEVSRRTLEVLAQMRPWVKFFGVLMWIGTVFIAIGSLGVLVVGLTGNMGIAEAAIMAVMYGMMAIFYVYFARVLTTCASKLRDLDETHRVVDLEDALISQKNFWKGAGIMTIAMIVLYIVLIVFMVAGLAFMVPFGRGAGLP